MMILGIVVFVVAVLFFGLAAFAAFIAEELNQTHAFEFGLGMTSSLLGCVLGIVGLMILLCNKYWTEF